LFPESLIALDTLAILAWLCEFHIPLPRQGMTMRSKILPPRQNRHREVPVSRALLIGRLDILSARVAHSIHSDLNSPVLSIGHGLRIHKMGSHAKHRPLGVQHSLPSGSLGPTPGRTCTCTGLGSHQFAWRLPTYSAALIPASLISLAHRGSSDLMSAANSAGVFATTSIPASLRRLRTSFAVRVRTVS
jgi:hypothetical protein